MKTVSVTAEELVQGASPEYELAIPLNIVNPAGNKDTGDKTMIIKIKTLTIEVFQLILKAARDDDSLIPLLVVKEAVIEPKLTFNQIKRMHVGLITFIVERIREVSGMTGE